MKTSGDRFEEGKRLLKEVVSDFNNCGNVLEGVIERIERFLDNCKEEGN